MDSSQYPKREHHSYDNKHVLQNVDVYLPRPLPSQERSRLGYWVVYIHGGAWRDPEILAPSFTTTQDILCNSRSGSDDDIIGYASINYRLTAHPSFPQKDTNDDPASLRNAKHPDHLHDVQNALAFLQAQYSIGERYILVGHSCGATLAFQSVSLRDNVDTIPHHPVCIVGVSGIYDLRLLRDTHRSSGAYQEFIEDAFGKAEDEWDQASPVRGVDGWNGRLAFLAHSSGDELVDEPQLKAMETALEEWKKGGDRRRVIATSDLRESHDDIWKNGVELAEVIKRAVGELRLMESPAS